MSLPVAPGPTPDALLSLSPSRSAAAAAGQPGLHLRDSLRPNPNCGQHFIPQRPIRTNAAPHREQPANARASHPGRQSSAARPALQLCTTSCSQQLAACKRGRPGATPWRSCRPPPIACGHGGGLAATATPAGASRQAAAALLPAEPAGVQPGDSGTGWQQPHHEPGDVRLPHVSRASERAGHAGRCMMQEVGRPGGANDPPS